MKYIQGIHRKSKIHFPEYIDDYVSQDNPVRIIDAFVMSLDMCELGFKNAKPSKLGRDGYDPRDLLKLYIYGYLNSITSSRKLEKECTRNIEVMWLLKLLKPKFKTISTFRKDNKQAIKNVFKKFVTLCKEWDLYGKEVVAIDGSKFRACNSKKNNFNQKKLNRKIKYLENKIQKYMKKIEENDDEEKSNRELSKEEISNKINELKERKRLYEEHKEKISNTEINEISTTDPDSRLMSVNNNGIDVCYNVQTAVDSKYCLIVDCNVINNPTDHGQLSILAKNSKTIFEVENLKVLADKGYYNGEDLKKCEEEEITTYVSKQVFANSTGNREFYVDKFKYDKEKNVYICPEGKELICKRRKPITEKTKYLNYNNYEACKKCENISKCTKSKKGRTVKRSINQDFLDKVDERTKNNKKLYRKRQMIVEHPFGTIKRNWGITHFVTKGIESVKVESSLAFLAYNIRRAMNILGTNEMLKKLIVKKRLLTSLT